MFEFSCSKCWLTKFYFAGMCSSSKMNGWSWTLCLYMDLCTLVLVWMDLCNGFVIFYMVVDAIMVLHAYICAVMVLDWDSSIYICSGIFELQEWNKNRNKTGPYCHFAVWRHTAKICAVQIHTAKVPRGANLCNLALVDDHLVPLPCTGHK